MKKNEKKLWVIGGISFVFGGVMTLIILSLCGGSIYGTHKHFGSHHLAKMEMIHHNMDKMAFEPKQHGFDMRKKGKRSFAHKALRAEPTAEMKAKFAEKLGLTDEQKVKLEEMRKEDMAKMEPLFKQMESLRIEMKALRKSNREHFESVLTEEQKEILKKMKREYHPVINK